MAIAHSSQNNSNTIPSSEALGAASDCSSAKDSTSTLGGIPRCKSKSLEDQRFVRVEEMTFQIPAQFFLQMPASVQSTTGFTENLGKSDDQPILLNGHTADEFLRLVWAFSTFPYIDIGRLTLDHLLTIAELSLRYCLKDLMAWSIKSLSSVVNSPSTPLRAALSNTFIRMLKLAVMYQRVELSSSIQVKWLTRIHWRELSPIPALLVADAYGLRHLLSHAYYVHLVSLAPRISRVGKIAVDNDSPLSPKQNMHVLCGYYSLLAYWNVLRLKPPAFSRAPNCASHVQCVSTWELRWVTASSRPSKFSDIDVLSRLRLMEQFLESDMLLSVCMTVQCRTMALASLSKKRETIANSLHHHFDL